MDFLACKNKNKRLNKGLQLVFVKASPMRINSFDRSNRVRPHCAHRLRFEATLPWPVPAAWRLQCRPSESPISDGKSGFSETVKNLKFIEVHHLYVILHIHIIFIYAYDMCVQKNMFDMQCTYICIYNTNVVLHIQTLYLVLYIDIYMCVCVMFISNLI